MKHFLLKIRPRIFNAVTLGVFFILVIASVLIGTSLWNGEKAKESAEEAVHSISEFYLRELGNRRSLAISGELDQTILHLGAIFDVARERTIQNQDDLRSFLQMVKELYGYDKLVVVDEHELLYTSHSTISGISRYNFLIDKITKPTFYTANLYGARKQMILAAPLKDIRMGKTKLTTSFIQIDLSEMLSVITKQTDENETINSVYYSNGENITGTDTEDEENILNQLKSATFIESGGYDKLKADFASGTSGFTSFRQGHIINYMYYTPVEGTHWMFTVMIRESAISNNISDIRKGMLRNSVTQILVIVAVMMLAFILFFIYSKRMQKKETHRLIRVSQTDAMTGVYNRGGGEKAIRKALEAGAEGFFFLLDADKFKSINDNYGHDVGDQVIIAIADSMKATFRDEDILMRLGGDEFAVYALGVCNKEAADRVIRRFFSVLETIDIPSLGDRPIYVSLGAAFWTSDCGWSFDELYKNADTRLYYSKEREGNSVTYYNE